MITPRTGTIVEHIDEIVKSLEKHKAVIEGELFMMDVEIGALGRIRTFVLTGVDTFEDCKRCGHPRFCHEDGGCSGNPHSGGHDDCNLRLFEPGGSDE